MPNSRAKRQFIGAATDPAQRQITSFFHKNGTGGSSSHADSREGITSSPALPAHVQSSLINVGMRVRKSVPEGYKTGSEFGAFNLWTDAHAKSGSSMASGPSPSAKPPSSSSSSSSSSSFGPTGQRELVPFCAINSVGGLSSQPPSFLAHTASSVPSSQDIPSLASSQVSIASSSSSSAMAPAGLTLTNRKRIHSDSEESDTPSISNRLQVRRSDWMDGEISPRSHAPVGWENVRVVAQPRRRSGQKAAAGVAGAGGGLGVVPLVDQENMVVDDFEDAAFLDYQALEGDLDMGGV